MIRRVLVLLVFLMASCIEVYNFSSEQEERALVVEGYITTQPGIHQIRLTKTEKFGPDFIGLNRTEARATVLIKDDLGRVIKLEEGNDRGIYFTPDGFSAEVGRSYNLEITLFDGKRYISRPEKVYPVPEIDSISYHAVKNASIDRLNEEFGVQVMAHFQDPEEQSNYYYWKMLESTFALITEPHLTRREAPALNLPFDIDNTGKCCSRCFHTDIPKPTNIITTDDVDFNGNYQRRMIAYIEDNGLRFKETYRLDLQHLSVSPETHRFLKLVDQQLRLTGSVFDPPPANIRGNMISLNDPEEVVLGQFFVSDERRLRIYIHKRNLEFYKLPQTIVPINCVAFLFQNPIVGYPSIPLPVDPPIDWDPEG
jgi:hypothetical protein